jgi:hypothetical protein
VQDPVTASILIIITTKTKNEETLAGVYWGLTMYQTPDELLESSPEFG